MELVSVIIPVYNAEKFISDCIDSVLNQSWKQWEVILIDDGSTDDSLSVIKKKVGSDNRFLIVTQQNSGAPAARNYGLSLAKGKYIQFLDADDCLSANKLKNQVQVLESNPNAVAWSATAKFSQFGYQDNIETKNLILKKKLTRISNPFDFLLCLNGDDGEVSMIQPNAYMASAKLISQSGGWNEDLKYSPDDDSEYFTRVLINAEQIIFDPLSINYYRVSLLPSVSKRFDRLAAEGALKTVVLKFSTLLKISNEKKIIDLYAHHLTVVAYIYGSKFPVIVDQVKKQLDELGVSKFSLVGGFYFKLISSFIGFKSAIKLKAKFK